MKPYTLFLLSAGRSRLAHGLGYYSTLRIPGKMENAVPL